MEDFTWANLRIMALEKSVRQLWGMLCPLEVKELLHKILSERVICERVIHQNIILQVYVNPKKWVVGHCDPLKD